MSALRASSFLALLVLAGACRGAGAQRARERDVHYLVQQERFEDALEVAHAAYRAKATAKSEEEYRLASTAYLLSRARQQTLDDEDEVALETLEEAQRIAPDSDEVAQWIRKTHDKLAWRWFDLARERHADDDLSGAVEAYEKALLYDPEHQEALAGILRVGIQLQYREGLAEKYYNEGLVALRDYELRLARSRFTYAHKYREQDPKPVRRVSQVQVGIARDMVEHADDLQAEGYYAAARTEYRLARALDQENELAAEGFERMDVEARASRLFDKGEMWRLRKGWDRAEEVLKEGQALTVLQKERFQDALDEIHGERTRARYLQALNLERDFRYEEAIASYRALLDEVEFFEDSRARLTSLEATIAEVQELYGRLPDTEDPEEQRKLLLRIDALWPEYKDVEQRLDALERP